MPGVCNYERLLECDEKNRSVSYNLEENQFGFKGYVAKANPPFKATDDGGTTVSWNYEVEAVEIYTAEVMAEGMSSCYKSFLKDLEKAARRLANALD